MSSIITFQKRLALCYWNFLSMPIACIERIAVIEFPIIKDLLFRYCYWSVDPWPYGWEEWVLSIIIDSSLQQLNNWNMRNRSKYKFPFTISPTLSSKFSTKYISKSSLVYILDKHILMNRILGISDPKLPHVNNNFSIYSTPTLFMRCRFGNCQ